MTRFCNFVLVMLLLIQLKETDKLHCLSAISELHWSQFSIFSQFSN